MFYKLRLIVYVCNYSFVNGDRESLGVWGYFLLDSEDEVIWVFWDIV